MEQTSADKDASSLARNEAADSRATGEAVSSDIEWSDTDESPVPSIVDDEDYETHESCEEVEGGVDGLSLFLVDESVAEQSSRLIRDDPCEKKRLKFRCEYA
ncbi:hypothetical protein JG687_00018891 [Phytophthora cactorum]|uniref:Uncharacterized protein n=1 Tax=Phytophthora cactorum TaxID=29920 RepID=A0A8T1TNK9_9STRA|nr:hypothetical protein PC120_g7665 [Phytophthora cactorum]KAG3069607.1 hypothetical protein PC121_g9756 [Phytophthora cactorum]KAG3197811.1 hypothetical protein PC128_g6512 [Phytophthora cactorum]KAG4039306.1 hypothetical protein PC123_g25138 [Phytophthora cactorum]KAG6942735.1 hypothetical protein JG687_00018891 [Phytophthora cactorum]